MSTLTVYGTDLASRFLLGSAGYLFAPGAARGHRGQRHAGVTVIRAHPGRRRRQRLREWHRGQRGAKCACCPTPPGCRTPHEAITLAHTWQRTVRGTRWIKLEVVKPDEHTLQPDPGHGGRQRSSSRTVSLSSSPHRRPR
ncbi:MAG: hypothetical protein R3E42_12185 [Burkholderiaceae bacterium]